MLRSFEIFLTGIAASTVERNTNTRMYIRCLVDVYSMCSESTKWMVYLYVNDSHNRPPTFNTCTWPPCIKGCTRCIAHHLLIFI
ncbi:hypothetical protein FKM82_018788 [Ascaphus truei]